MKRRLELERVSIGSDLLAEFKHHIRVTGTAQDTELTRYLNVAVRDLEDATRRLLAVATVKEYFDVWPWRYVHTLELERAPVTSVTSVKYYDLDGVLQTWSSDNYDTDTIGEPARIILADGATVTVPSVDDRPNAVVVEYESGLAAADGETAAAENLDAQTMNAVFVRAAWLYGPGRELAPDMDPEAVSRCWWQEIRRLQWTL
jgi:uncharacterized phiE125 gp8 family phage protein